MKHETRLLSTKLGGTKRIDTLDRAALHALCKKATTITVVSAFYDRAFLDMIVDGIPASRRKSVKLDVYLHGFSGSRLRNDLEVLREWASEQVIKANVFLVAQGALFHSKILSFIAKDETTVLIGSANATTAAYEENEEIMLAITGKMHDGIEEYLDRVATHSTPLKGVQEPEVRNLVAFFRTGDIYYKPNALPLFRFDLRLPDKLRKKLSALTQNIRGFSAKTSRTYNPFDGPDDEEVDEGASKVNLHPFAVETCFGWWAPRAYVHTIDQMITEASTKKALRLETIRDAFEMGAKDGRVKKQAEKSFDLLVNVANEYGIPLEETRNGRIDRFDEFVGRCLKQINNARWFERATRAFDHAPMPEVWADPIARDEFERSFFDYLQYVNTGASRRPKLLTNIADAVRLTRDDGADEIRDKLITYLRDNGWSGSEWKDRDVTPETLKLRPVKGAFVLTRK